MTSHRIYIFTEPVQSGKTTLLQQWLRNSKETITGILTPDRDGRRMLYDIAEDKYHELEMPEDCPAEDCLFVGKFRFGREGFKKAQEILLRDMNKDAEWLIVDEVGKLEMNENSGLEPALTEVVNTYKNGETKGNLLLVVRNYLRDEVIERFGLSDDRIVHKSFFE